MNESLVRVGLEIEPLDPLFFRGGRPFGPATRAEGGLPFPQTLAGALRNSLLAAHGFDFARFQQHRRSAATGAVSDLLDELGAPRGVTRARFRGPWFRTRPCNGQPGTVLLPTPANLYRDDDSRTWWRADPLADVLPGWNPERPGARPLWRRGGADAKRPGGFLTLDGISRFLEGKLPEPGDWVEDHCLYDFDDRTGLEIDADALTGIDGRLFATRRIALKPGVCFYAEAILPASEAQAVRDRLGGPFPWGGEGRYALARVLDQPLAWPRAHANPAGANPLWLLVTPGVFARGEVPDGISDTDLLAVACGSAVAFSGWDVARGAPRPTRFAAPAGTVYFLCSGASPERDADSLCGDAEDRAQGWGFALRGVWNDA